MDVDVLIIRLGDMRTGALLRYAPPNLPPVIRFVADDAYAARPPDSAPVLSVSMLAAHPGQQQSLWYDRANPLFNGVRGADGDLQLPAWFQGLLPEGMFLREVATTADSHPHDHFRILAACGLDLPGAVTARWEHISSEDLQRLILWDGDALELRATAPGLQGSMAIAGVQPKIGVNRDAGGRYLGRTGSEDTRIIAKLPVVGFPRMPEVEHLSLLMAEAAGVATCIHRLAPLRLLTARHHYDLGDEADGNFLAVERFDRSESGRLHHETMAQALGIPPARKYAGATYIDIGSVLMSLPRCGEPAVHELLRRLTVNELLGNSDAHLANLGLIYRDGITPEFSPAYDVVAQCLYGDRGGHALHFLSCDERAELSWLPTRSPETVREFCETLRIAVPPASAAVRETIRKALVGWPSLIRKVPITDRQRAALRARIRQHPMTASIVARRSELAQAWS